MKKKSSSLPKTLIINGAGFIGFHLSLGLAAKKCQVFCLDKPASFDKKNLKKLKKTKNLKIVKFNRSQKLLDLKQEFTYIFYLFSRKKSLVSPDSVLEFAKKQKAKLILVALEATTNHQRNVEAKAADYFSRFDLDVRMIRLVDVYGPKMPLDKKDNIGRLFNNWQAKTTFKLPGDGSRLIRPLYITDALEAILKAIFSSGTKGRAYLVAGKEELSILRLAQIIKKESGSTLGVEFVAAERDQSNQLDFKKAAETRKQLNWQPKVSIETGIEKTLAWLNRLRLASIGEPAKSKLGLKKRLLNKKSFWFFSLILLFLISGFLLTRFIFYYLRTANQLKIMRDSLADYRLETVQQEAPATIEAAEAGRLFLLNSSWVFSVLGLEEQRNHCFDLFGLGIDLARTGQLTVKTVNSLERLARIVLEEKKGSVAEQKDKLTYNLRGLWEQVSVIEARQIARETEALKQQLPFQRGKISLALELVNVLPDLLAFEGEKTYLILYQNNLQLRPSGGVIDAFGLLTFKQGRLASFETLAVDAASRDLKGRIDPPQPIKKHLTNSWTLRDVGWFPHFQVNTKQAEWFLKEGMNQEVEGTIALDLYFAKSLLEQLGPIQLTNNQAITADNLFSQLINQARKNNDQNSEHLVVFWQKLSSQVLEKLKTIEGKEWLDLAAATTDSLNQKNLLLSLKDNSSRDFFDQFGWNGAIRQTSQQQEVLTDFIMLARANLSGLNLDYFLEKEVVQKVIINEQGEINEELKISYCNNSSKDKGLSGDYQNYLRVYLPQGARVENIMVGKGIGGLKSLPANQVNVFEAYNKQGVGFLVTIPSQEKRIVKLTYTLGKKINPQEQSYVFYWQKQPGDQLSPLTFQIEFPADWQLAKTQPQAETSPGLASWQTNTQEDRLFLTVFQ